MFLNPFFPILKRHCLIKLTTHMNVQELSLAFIHLNYRIMINIVQAYPWRRAERGNWRASWLWESPKSLRRLNGLWDPPSILWKCHQVCCGNNKIASYWKRAGQTWITDYLWFFLIINQSDSWRQWSLPQWSSQHPSVVFNGRNKRRGASGGDHNVL